MTPGVDPACWPDNTGQVGLLRCFFIVPLH
jgi:hypothetical protein